ncbi:MAG TPA: AraC family transcriptional regulator [Candidatus Butyricicoccus avistercoris]|uniref:AraC family transcriptional regulator n=1 Tax=Candidatus Butyricicoccus avistercoris TaxID=2838518 RepID=A0A9D1TH35_9FIRM|nr:AraC family transcriptional regulator [Candidatus Butyricicoccus avistercoris]
MQWHTSFSNQNMVKLKPLESDINIAKLLVLSDAYNDISVNANEDIIFELDEPELAIISVNNGKISLQTTQFDDVVCSGCAIALTTFHGKCHITSNTTSTISILLFSGSLWHSILEKQLSKRMLLFNNSSIRLFLSSLPECIAEISDISAISYSFLLSLRNAVLSEQAHYPFVVEAALNIIEEDYAFLEGVQDLAERVEVSVGHLTRLFKQSIGLTPLQCLTQFRIAHSKQLLLDDSLSIAMIANLCGFANANYFAKVFRHEVGMSPSEYLQTKNISNKKAKSSDIYLL